MFYVFDLYDFQISEALEIPSKSIDLDHDLSPNSLWRSNSSPSILSGSLDTMSPRDSISDIVQFGPPPPKGDKSKPSTAAGDSPLQEDKDSPDSIVKDTLLPLTDQSVKEKPSLPQVLFKVENSQSVPKEYTSLLTKQLSPSPESSETSSVQDEVAELPVNLRRQRGHTIAAIKQTSPTMHDIGTGRTGKDSKVGISPSFVFLQLYHSGQLQLHDAPLLIPDNEVSNVYNIMS